MSAHGTFQAVRGPERISSYAEDLFGHLPRADQRRWALTYLRGLLTAPGRKSVRRLARAVSDSPTAAQSLQQFVNSSPWEWDPVRAALARWTEQQTGARSDQQTGAQTGVRAWTVGLSVQPKRGQHSVGVHRRFVPESGRTVSCQAGVGLFLTTGGHSAGGHSAGGHSAGRLSAGGLATAGSAIPVDWRLLLPERWSGDARLRLRTRIPDSVSDRSLGAHILEMADSLAARTSCAVPPLVANIPGCPQLPSLLHELSRRRQEFVLAVPDSLAVLPCAPDGRPSAYGPELTAVPARHFRGLDRSPAVHTTTVRPSGPLPRPVGMRSGLVRLAGAPELRSRTAPSSSRTAQSAQSSLRLFTGTAAAGRPARLWITNALRRRPDELLALTALPALTDGAVRSLRDDFGLLNFEGRSFPGWHHHMTLISAAYAYSRLAAPAEQCLRNSA
ncbi:transposase [Streptomyces sp. NBC_01766]|uniref:transposase n=1 Tax=Streptomyces sp. NBC_01766 TaxID=2975936 RepID=UPI002DD7E220|nr:transposase [Streptomyces sp. NBC_01766]WSC25144.1 transposase [Streptomyces sp. NBC_01766]